jgi:hypothetical protein
VKKGLKLAKIIKKNGMIVLDAGIVLLFIIGQVMALMPSGLLQQVSTS